MVKKVEYRGSFLTEYKKDIEGASELLKKLPKNEKLKKSMAYALLSCLSEAAEMHSDVSYDYDDDCGGDYLAHYLFEIENKFSEDKRPLVWLCGYLSYKLISYNSNNIRAVIISEEVLSSDLSDLIGPENYDSLFVNSSVSESEFLNKIIELSEHQLKEGWGFSECLGQSIERNICIEIGARVSLIYFLNLIIRFKKQRMKTKLFINPGNVLSRYLWMMLQTSTTFY